MGGDWLNHRMICYIERDVFAKIKDEDILYHFQELKTRMKKLPPLPQTRASGTLHTCIDIFLPSLSLSNDQLYFMDYITNLYVCSGSYDALDEYMIGEADPNHQ